MDEDTAQTDRWTDLQLLNTSVQHIETVAFKLMKTVRGESLMQETTPDRAGSGRAEFERVGSGRAGFGRVGLGGVGSGRAGLKGVELEGAGSGRVGLGRAALGRVESGGVGLERVGSESQNRVKGGGDKQKEMVNIVISTA